MPKFTVADHYEAAVNSSEFQNFCDQACPMKDTACRHYCPIFMFRVRLGAIS